MGLLTLLDSREHRLAQLWKKVVRLAVRIVQRRRFDVERC